MTEYLYDNWNPVTRRGTTIEIDSETGLPLIVQTQDLKPIIEANKRQANAFDKHQAGAARRHHPCRAHSHGHLAAAPEAGDHERPEGAQCVAG